MKYRFRGTSIQLFGTVTQPVTRGYPKVTYQIDNNPIEEWDLSPGLQDTVNTQSHVAFYKSREYTYGDHTLSVNVGDFDPRTTGRLNFDFFIFYGATEQDVKNAGGLMFRDDSDYGPVYEGGWSLARGMKQEFKSGAHQTPAGSEGTAILPFNGTCVEVYATLDGDYGSKPIASFVVDRGTSHEVVRTFPGPGRVTTQFNTRLLSVHGLVDGPHSLTVTALGKDVSPWRLDYFVYGVSNETNIDNGTGGGGASGVSSSVELSTRSATPRVVTSTFGGRVFTTTESVSPLVSSLNSPEDTHGGVSSNQQTVGETQAHWQSKRAVIIAGVLGGIAAGILSMLLLCWCIRRRRNTKSIASIDQYRDSIKDDISRRPTDMGPVPPIPRTKEPNTLPYPHCHSPRPSIDTASSVTRTNQPPRAREVDAGIRLEWTDEEGPHDTLPPSYSNYQS